MEAEILDTAGTDQFEGMRDMYIASGDAFVCVYAVDSKASFIEVSKLVGRIRRLKRKVSEAKQGLSLYLQLGTSNYCG